MDPIAIELGKLKVRWYGIFAALGFLAGYSVVKLRARTRDFRQEVVDQLVFWMLVGGIAGARGMYVLTHWGEFDANWVKAIAIWEGGLVFYGGFIGAFAAAYIAATVKRLSKRELADMVVPALPLGHALGRIGCFLNGCCFGKPYDGPLAFTYEPFKNYSHIAGTQQELGHLPHGITECLPVFPVQLLAAALNVLLFAVLLLIERRLPRKGQLFAAYLILYSIFRFSTEFLRGDYLERTAGLTPAQIICLVLLPIGIITFAALGKMTDGKRGEAHASA